MSTTDSPPIQCPPEPLPENFTSVQPGGGVCYRVELAWGYWRRWWLRHFRPGYVRRMAQLRQGEPGDAPHEILDPRDLKYCRNRCGYRWAAEDDPFAWRERLPFARWGLAELQLLGWPLLGLTVFFLCFPFPWRLLAAVSALGLFLVVYFFRDPPRRVPQEPGLIVSPADGRVADIALVEDDEFIGSKAIRIGIFLSIFDVHLNRAPAACRVLALRYAPGKFLNALRGASAQENEHAWIGLEAQSPPHRRMVVRQISGAIARRIVCSLRPGEELKRGEKFGMIKLGSRTELMVADAAELEVTVRVGQRVQAGSSVVARYRAANPK